MGEMLTTKMCCFITNSSDYSKYEKKTNVTKFQMETQKASSFLLSSSSFDTYSRYMAEKATETISLVLFYHTFLISSIYREEGGRECTLYLAMALLKALMRTESSHSSSSMTTDFSPLQNSGYEIRVRVYCTQA